MASDAAQQASKLPRPCPNHLTKISREHASSTKFATSSKHEHTIPMPLPLGRDRSSNYATRWIRAAHYPSRLFTTKLQPLLEHDVHLSSLVQQHIRQPELQHKITKLGPNAWRPRSAIIPAAFSSPCTCPGHVPATGTLSSPHRNPVTLTRSTTSCVLNSTLQIPGISDTISEYAITGLNQTENNI